MWYKAVMFSFEVLLWPLWVMKKVTTNVSQDSLYPSEIRNLDQPNRTLELKKFSSRWEE